MERIELPPLIEDLKLAESPVPGYLNDAAKIYKQRNLIYGDSYKKFGKLMFALFPDGVNCKGEDDLNRLGVLNMIVSKLMRYANNFSRGGHDDSLDDIAVYVMMLKELDQIHLKSKS
jgi:hypothetical protein